MGTPEKGVRTQEPKEANRRGSHMHLSEEARTRPPKEANRKAIGTQDYGGQDMVTNRGESERRP
jgi:hypothetical protein